MNGYWKNAGLCRKCQAVKICSKWITISIWMKSLCLITMHSAVCVFWIYRCYGLTVCMLVESSSSDVNDIWPKGFGKAQRENILLAHVHILALPKKTPFLRYYIRFATYFESNSSFLFCVTWYSGSSVSFFIYFLPSCYVEYVGCKM